MRATITTSGKKCEPEVPVVSYEQGRRVEGILDIPAGQSSGPVTPLGQDQMKRAIPLTPGASKYLTPTLSKFTLPGKVAVITGSVWFLLRLASNSTDTVAVVVVV